MNPIVVSEDLVNKVLGYLGTKPYQEVYQLIQEIQKQAKPLKQAVEEVEPSNGSIN
jgi:hypothetical protein